MALAASAKRANVEGSLWAYVDEQLGASFASGAAIDYGGGFPFNDAALAEWLQVRLLEPARPATGVGPRGMAEAELRYATEVTYLLNLNIFVRPAKQATPNALRLATLRDIVAAPFTWPTAIPVHDHAGDASFVGALSVDGWDADRPVVVPERENELLQWNLLVALRWAEEWT